MASVMNRINKIFKKTKAEVIFLMNTEHHDSNFIYLTNFTSGVFEYNTLIVTKRKLVLPVSELEYEIAKEQKPKEMEVIKVKSRKEIRAIMKRYMKSKVVGVNESFLPYASYASIKKNIKPKKIIDIYNAFATARAIKDKAELSNIRIANKIARKAIDEVAKELKVGMTERQAAARINYSMMSNGASGVAFESIVAFDKNSALPHHMPDSTKLGSNGIVLMDIGAKYNNYCSDITRTFIFKPQKGSDKYKRFMEMYKTVEEAQRIGYGKIRDGVEGSVAHNAAAEYIDSAKNGIYKGKFIHSLGHSIGIDVHDTGPGLGRGKQKLKENMVVSDEPGIYIVGFGGVRIEDDIIVTKKGATII